MLRKRALYCEQREVILHTRERGFCIDAVVAAFRDFHAIFSVFLCENANVCTLYNRAWQRKHVTYSICFQSEKLFIRSVLYIVLYMKRSLIIATFISEYINSILRT